MLIEVMKHMVQGTLGITRIMGELVETGEPALFLEAKGIAKKMAEALGMPEAQLSVTRVTHENL